jgi:hypothetical protein
VTEAPSDTIAPAPRPRKRSTGGGPSDVDIAQYSAARGFLAAEWFGATLMVASFTLLYLLALGADASPVLTYVVCIALLALGTAVFFRCRTYYARIGTDIAPKTHAIAAVVAGSAGIFWLLFVLLVTLAWLGVPLQ